MKEEAEAAARRIVGRAVLRARLITWGVVGLVVASDAVIHLMT